MWGPCKSFRSRMFQTPLALARDLFGDEAAGAGTAGTPFAASFSGAPQAGLRASAQDIYERFYGRGPPAPSKKRARR